MSRRWIRLWVNELLRGNTLFELKDDEFGVFMKLLVLAGSCRNDRGVITAGNGTPFPDEWITVTLNIPPELFLRAKQRLIDVECISANGEGIRITNWDEYQTEYDRQKPFREAKKAKDIADRDPDPDKFIKGKYGHLVKR